MKKVTTVFIAIAVLLIAACSASKRAAKSKPAPAASASTGANSAIADNPFLPKPVAGMYAPGNEELTAIQAHYKEVTMDKLNEGYTIYTQGACINCHNPKDIHRINETAWKEILDDMAQKAQISAEKKDAVYKYVLAIKATQRQ